MADFHYVRPDEMFSLFASVSGSADASYNANWLCDGRPGRPVRASSGASWWISNSAKTVSLVALCNHNVPAGGSITVGGDLSAALTGPAMPADGIPVNPWAQTTPTSVSALTVAISGNVTVGEFVAGTLRTLERQLFRGATFTPHYDTLQHEAEFNSLVPYDKALAWRTLEGETIVSDSGLADIRAWYDSTRGGVRPTLIIPISTVQDAWLVKFTGFSASPQKANINEVSLAFEEWPRSRW
jgi:hypothetical protein